MNNGESWLIDPQTRDYQMDSAGRPVIDTSLKMPMFFRAAIPRLGWMYAPDTRYGSDFKREKKKQPANVATLFRAIGQRCLQPLVDDGRAQSVSVEAGQVARKGVVVDLGAVDSSGRPQQIRGLDPVGLG